MYDLPVVELELVFVFVEVDALDPLVALPTVNTLPGWIKSEPPFSARASDNEIPKARATVYKPSPDFTVYDLPVAEDPVLVLVEVDALDEVVALPAVNTLPGWIKSDPPFKLRASVSVIPSSRATVYKPSPAFTVYDLPVDAEEPVLVVAPTLVELDDEEELVFATDNTCPG